MVFIHGLFLFLQMSLPAVPVFLSVTGLFDVEFRIVVSCRNGGVYTLKRYAANSIQCIPHFVLCSFVNWLIVHVYYQEYICTFSGDRQAKLCFELNSQPVGMARLNKTIVVGCMDETLQCYTSKVCGYFYNLKRTVLARVSRPSCKPSPMSFQQ